MLVAELTEQMKPKQLSERTVTLNLQPGQKFQIRCTNPQQKRRSILTLQITSGKKQSDEGAALFAV
ncbi:MAG: hypothetical protein R3F37_00505 [Candidatus Competibacteraceae bacterium]